MSKVYVEAEEHHVYFTNKDNSIDRVVFFGDNCSAVVPVNLIHKSIPHSTPEVEWSPEKWYDFFEAMYLARKYDLEVRHIDRDGWYRGRKDGDWYKVVLDDAFFTQEWKLRKPVSAEEKLAEIIGEWSHSERGFDFYKRLEEAGLEIRFKL